MKKTSLTALVFSVLAMTGSLFAQAKPAQKEEKTVVVKESEKPWYDKINYSGYVDVYYNYTSNNRQGNQYDSSGTFHGYNKQFAINAVKLSMEKTVSKESPWGFRLDMQNGTNNVFQERPYLPTSNAANMNMLQQAYVSFLFPLGRGLTLDVGKMATHLGNEVLDSKDNISYTIGYIFFNTIPFIHTGARVGYNITDDWKLTFYVYNSVIGTGYNNPYSGQYNASSGNLTTDYASAGAQASPLRWTANDSMNSSKMVGHRLEGNIVKDRVKWVWNTGISNDFDQGRVSNATWNYYEVAGLDPSVYAVRPGSNIRKDYWGINHMSFIFTPTEKMFILLDWTYGERAGNMTDYYAAYNTNGFKIDTNNDGLRDFTVARSGRSPKRIYNTYGIFAKYTFTDTFALGFRFEYLDDSRYGGPLVVNAPLYAQNPLGRQDLAYASANFGRPTANLGQIKTLTFTPTYTWSENILVKLDLRRDFGPGEQFIDMKGRPSSHQDGAILGVVAKF